jgi:hypothetical protein
MAHPSTQLDTAELLKQLLVRLAISPAHEQQAAAIITLTNHHSQTREDVEGMKASYDKFAVQQTLMRDQHDKLYYKFEDIKKQLSTIASMRSEIEVLRSEKEELRASIRYV